MNETFIVKHFEIPIYKGYLVVVFTNTSDIVELIDDFNDAEIYAHAVSHRYKGKDAYFCIFNPFDHRISPGVVAHEAYHAANFIMAGCGIVLDYENDEPAAYLIEWIMDKIFFVALKNNINLCKL